MRTRADTTIVAVAPDEAAGHVPALGLLLHDCVTAGASINFVLPFSLREAEAFWRIKVVPPVEAGTRSLWLAVSSDRVVGSVQLDTDTPPNQPHRAEVTKLMVHPDMRRGGIARALMAALEQRAREKGRSLITLDTRTGDIAEPLYTSLGYITVGTIPGFCRDTVKERYDPTTIMYKQL